MSDASEPSNRVCVINHSKPVEARHGLMCTPHFDRLSAMLRDVEEQAAILSAAPSMEIRIGSGSGSLASELAPARIDVLAFNDPQTRRWTRDDVSRHPLPAPKRFGPWCLFCDHDTCTDWRAGRRRDLHDDEHDAGSDRLMSILGVLNGWAHLVREERNLTPPRHVTVSGERDTLTRHLDWLAGQPFIDDAYAEIRELAATLKVLNGTQDDKPVGRCYLPKDVGICNGPIWVDDAAGHAHCGRCAQTWDGPQLALLKHEMDKAQAEQARPKTEDGRRMLTAAELVAQGVVSSPGNVWAMASRRGVRAVLGHYDPEWFTAKMATDNYAS